MAPQTATSPVSEAPVSAESIGPLQILTLYGITWKQYVTISDALPNRGGLRTAFDGSTYELMVTSTAHEMYKSFLGRMFEMLSFEMGIDIRCGGMMTFRREDLEKGLEPDECYWVAHEPAMRKTVQWQPDEHPPPDLAIEIDVTSSSVKRHEIYAALGVQELWRYQKETLRSFQLSDNGTYEVITQSIAVPGLDVADLVPFLERLNNESENTILRSFVEWIRETLR